MRVEEKGLRIKFEDVEVGRCFKSVEWGVFIKTSEELVNNAVCLNDGGLWDFGAEAEVIPVNAKVVIE